MEEARVGLKVGMVRVGVVSGVGRRSGDERGGGLEDLGRTKKSGEDTKVLGFKFVTFILRHKKSKFEKKIRGGIYFEGWCGIVYK